MALSENRIPASDVTVTTGGDGQTVLKGCPADYVLVNEYEFVCGVPVKVRSYFRPPSAEDQR